jgi:hypothetical protein
MVRPVPLGATALVVVAAIVAGAVFLRGGGSGAVRRTPSVLAMYKREFAVAIDASCFDTEDALPGGAVPTGAALGAYLDKALPILRNADDGQDHIPLPVGNKPLARQFLVRFHDYVTALGRYREAIRRGDQVAFSTASADAHRAFSDLVDMAEPLGSSYCPPLPQLP